MTTADISSANQPFRICPLYYFDSEIGDADISDTIQMKRMPREVAEFLGKHNSELFVTMPVQTDWILLISRSSHPSASLGEALKELDDLRELLFNVQASLRLCHGGLVTIGPVINAVLRAGHWEDFVFEIIIYTPFELMGDEDDSYLLKQSDIPDIRKFLKAIFDEVRIGHLHDLDIALSRFSKSYYGVNEDRLIDQTIALESLYIADDKELRYKLALRTAFFIGTVETRERIFNDIKKVYDLRSDIVHGTNADRPTLNELLPKNEDYLRQSLRKFILLISQGNSVRNIRDQLDKHILTNGQTLIDHGSIPEPE
ncbi:MAG: hypothetical protein V1771_00140 [Chloroflexota bacterium]